MLEIVFDVLLEKAKVLVTSIFLLFQLSFQNPSLLRSVITESCGKGLEDTKHGEKGVNAGYHYSPLFPPFLRGLHLMSFSYFTSVSCVCILKYIVWVSPC